MRKRFLPFMLVASLFAALLLNVGVAKANSVGATDPALDQIDPFVTQNASVKANCSGSPTGWQKSPGDLVPPPAGPLGACGFKLVDLKSWNLNFDGTSIILTEVVDGNIPVPGPNLSVDAPPGFVGASYRVVFNTPNQELEQKTGKNCGAYTDNHPAHKPHQDARYAKCTNAYSGPFPALDGWKFFIDYGVTEGLAENVGSVTWGWYDPAYGVYWFNEISADETCATGSGFALGGSTGCRWSAKVTDGADDTLVVKIPYKPTWRLADDGDDNGSSFAAACTPTASVPCPGDDEIRAYQIVDANDSVTGIVASTWVNQTVQSPEPICTPTDDKCSPPVGTDSNNPPQPFLDTGKCIAATSQANCTPTIPTVAQYQAWVARVQAYDPNDCTPNNQQASCLNDLGGFIYLEDWSCGGCNANDGYYLGIAGPAYVPTEPRCRQPASLLLGRVPTGVAVIQDSSSQDGYTGVRAPYGVNFYSDPEYHPESNYDHGRKPGYQNVAIPAKPAGVPGAVPWPAATTIDNPAGNVFQPNPVSSSSFHCYTRLATGAQYDGGATVTAS